MQYATLYIEPSTALSCTPQVSQPKKSGEWKWWLVWVITLLCSLVPPAVFVLRDVEEILEPLRVGSLLPIPLLLLRDIAKFSCGIPPLLIGLIAFAIHQKQSMRSLICWGTFIMAVCSSLSAGYFLLIASAYIVQYTEVCREVSELRGQLISEENPETAPPAENTPSNSSPTL